MSEELRDRFLLIVSELPKNHFLHNIVQLAEKDFEICDCKIITDQINIILQENGIEHSKLESASFLADTIFEKYYVLRPEKTVITRKRLINTLCFNGRKENIYQIDHQTITDYNGYKSHSIWEKRGVEREIQN